MTSTLPVGDPVPADGSLPASAAAGAADRDFGVYIHVPFCRVRCGYCDFNTYTSTELLGARPEDYAEQAIREIRFAREVLERAGAAPRPASTVFFGGGTPTMLPPGDLVRMLDAVRAEFGLAAGAEVTTEANPDSVTAASLESLAAGGVTRVSFGMQSAVPEVLAVLDRTHDPERVPLVVEAARRAALGVSLDLIYGTPGERLADWQTSVEAALAMAPDHVSAYALIVEPGTGLARRIRRGEVPEPDDDLHADMYEWADERLAAAGYQWYELSNWAAAPEHRSRHNLAYWTGEDWWGVGPGAHSHVGGVRWWNAKHPSAYGQRITAGVSPAQAREVLSPDDRFREEVLLRARLRSGVPVTMLGDHGRRAVAGLIADGLIDGAAAIAGDVRLTRRGRLLADAVVRTLLP